MDELNPIRIGIGFNLLMVFANFAIPYDSRFGRWYFEMSGLWWIMGGVWIVLLTWAACR